MTRTRLTSSLAVAALVGAGAVGAHAATSGAGSPGAQPLELSGAVAGLLPGARAVLPVLIRNPNSREVTVADIQVAVTSPLAGCPADVLHGGALDTPVTVPASGSATATLPITLALNAPESCQGVVFALRYATTAVGPDLPADAGSGSVTTSTDTGTTGAGTSHTPAGPTTVTRRVRKRICRTGTVTVKVHGKRRHKRVRRCRTVTVTVRVPA